MFKIKPLLSTSKLPTKIYNGDAGFDVYNNDKAITLKFSERHKFPLGFAIELPSGWVAIINEKSGMAINQGIFTIGNIIDSTYRGECHAILVSLSHEPVTIEHGQKIAQMLVLPCYTGCDYEIIGKDEELSFTERGSGGFGSTGLFK